MLFSQDRAELQEARPARRATTSWLREQFTELGVIQFEDWADTGEEYEMFQLAEGEVASVGPQQAGGYCRCGEHAFGPSHARDARAAPQGVRRGGGGR